MTYLDYFTYIILIGLFLLLVHKIVLNDSSTKEGFVAGKRKKVKYDKNGIEIIDPDIPVPDPDWLTITKVNYNIAAQVAIMLIKMPYKFLSQGIIMFGRFIENVNEMLKPMREFAKQMFNLGRELFKKLFKPFFTLFKDVFKGLGNLPAFIKENAEKVINMMTDLMEQFLSTIQTLTDLATKMFDLIMKLPTMIFGLLNKTITMLFNVFIMIIKLPESLMGMVINFQEQMMELMDKSFKLPFTDLFFS